jgi:trehalase-like protein
MVPAGARYASASDAVPIKRRTMLSNDRQLALVTPNANVARLLDGATGSASDRCGGLSC